MRLLPGRKERTTAAIRSLSAVLLTLVVGFTSSAALALGNSWGLYKKPTILDKLIDTDGAQALVAAVQVVDASGVCPVDIAELLGNRKADLILLAPANPAFEALLNLTPGVLDGLGIEAIASALPEILADLGLDAETVCDVLLKHVSVREKSGDSGHWPYWENRKNRGNVSALGLLDSGSIDVADGSEFPVSIGGKGVAINYESTITQADVYTVNGVIHYLDAVIVDAAAPPPPDPHSVCDTELCAADATLSQQCDTFLNNCLMVEDEDECAGGALLICEGGAPDDVDASNVCSRDVCAVDAELAHECQTFLNNCLTVEDEDECVGGALLVCSDLF